MQALTRLPSYLNFNPRVPCGTRPLLYQLNFILKLFQSTRPMRDATFVHLVKLIHTFVISIHASHAGRDNIGLYRFNAILLFQSTRPMRDATSMYVLVLWIFKFQSTRPMRDATTYLRLVSSNGIFQSTRPMRDAT